MNKRMGNLNESCMSRDEQFQIQASALSAEAMTRIVAELGPRALTMQKDKYMASAIALADSVFGQSWDYRLTLDAAGAPHIFVESYRG